MRICKIKKEGGRENFPLTSFSSLLMMGISIMVSCFSPNSCVGGHGNTSSSPSSSLSEGAIAGITIAVIVGVATSGAAVFYYDKMARDKRRFMEEVGANSSGASNPVHQESVA